VAISLGLLCYITFGLYYRNVLYVNDLFWELKDILFAIVANELFLNVISQTFKF
jgi:hypothetical protein